MFDIKHNFSSKYPYHKFPDRKKNWHQPDLKVLKSQLRYNMLNDNQRYEIQKI